MVWKATAKFSMETFILFWVSETRDIFPWKLVEKTYQKTDTLYITMHTYNIFTGKSFLKVIVSRNVEYSGRQTTPNEIWTPPNRAVQWSKSKTQFLVWNWGHHTEYRYYINLLTLADIKIKIRGSLITIIKIGKKHSKERIVTN